MGSDKMVDRPTSVSKETKWLEVEYCPCCKSEKIGYAPNHDSGDSTTNGGL